MGFLSEWITHILLFILMAMVVELLLPNSAMQKYVKMVLGLLLMILMATPIFRLFSLDPRELLSEIESMMEATGISMEWKDKKNEIQEGQRAYILEQTTVHMEEITEKELMEQYGYEIAAISIDMDERWFESPPDGETVPGLIREISVILKKANPELRIEPVQEVEVSRAGTAADFSNREAIKSFLASMWGLDPERIAIQIKGGPGME
jgi:stage III sporulation protein AF